MSHTYKITLSLSFLTLMACQDLSTNTGMDMVTPTEEEPMEDEERGETVKQTPIIVSGTPVVLAPTPEPLPEPAPLPLAAAPAPLPEYLPGPPVAVPVLLPPEVEIEPEPGCHEFIINGGFETGDFTGFSQVNDGSGAWFINAGDPTPISDFNDDLGTISGSYDALTDQNGPGVHLLTQPIIIPGQISSATLTFKDRIRNRADVFSDPNQEYRVTLVDAMLEPIEELFSTDPGDDLLQFGPNERSFDLTDIFEDRPHQEVSVSFEEQDDLFYFNINLDDVSLIICSDCGNGHLQEGEQCDDGNVINGDGCSQDCRKELLFGSDSENQIFSFDPAEDKVEQIGKIPSKKGSTEIECAVGSICFSQGRDGSFTIERVRLDPPKVLGPAKSDGYSFTGLEFINTTLYGAGISSSCEEATLFILDPFTGTATEIGPVGTGRPMSGLAFNTASKIMYGIDGCGQDGPSNLYTVNLATGAATLIGSTGKKLGSLEFGPDKRLYAGGDASDGGNIYSLNMATGAATFVIKSGLKNVTGLTLSVAPLEH